MKLINQSAEIWEQPEGEIGIYKQIEKAARLCYKSEDKTTEDSYQRFMDMLNTNGHQSPLEHGTVYLQYEVAKGAFNPLSKYYNDKYSKVDFNAGQLSIRLFVTTNFRVIKEHGWEDDFKYICEPTEHHEKRISVHITTNRAISHELVRHRVFSFCQESQRYCNYSKGKFGNEVTFIIPSWVNTHCPNEEQKSPSIPDITWSDACKEAETFYVSLLQDGWKPQQAREVLPNSTKTELVMTGFESQWEEFFKLRCSPAAHPMMQELANQIKELMQNHK